MRLDWVRSTRPQMFSPRFDSEHENTSQGIGMTFDKYPTHAYGLKFKVPQI